MNAILRLLALVATTLSALAQDAPTTLRVQNLAPFARHEWVSCVVPFARGEVAGLPDRHVGGAPTVWQPIGARWDDGSLRQAQCLFPMRLDPLEERSVTLAPGPGPDLGDVPFALPAHHVRFVATIDGVRQVGEPVAVETLEDNAARRVFVLRGRIGTSGLVVEATLEVFRGQEHFWYGFGVFFSDPGSTALRLAIDELAVETEGLALFVRHGGPLGATTETTALGSRTVLLRDTWLGDGQGVRRAGVLVPPLAGTEDARLRDDTLKAASLCRPLGATSWVGTGAFGAFGHVPEPPPWLASEAALRAAMARKHADFVRWSRTQPGDPFRAARYGLAPSAHQAGEQADFGVVALEPVAWSGIPSFLLEVEWSVLQEGCRPVHAFEPDGAPVLAAAHPDWVAHNGRTHYHVPTSPDRLGKTEADAKLDAHKWLGKDNQHWSSNYLGAYYLLTGDPQVLLELRNEVQLWLASQTLRPQIATSNPGAARAAGRTMLAATWLYLCTGDGDLLERMRRRMHDVNCAHWAPYRDVDPARVRPFDVKGPDPRYFENSADPVWVPWEEALAVVGFAAYRELTGDRAEEVDTMIDGLALNLLRHGWRVLDDGRAEIAYAIRLVDEGRPLTAAERLSRTFVNWPKSSFGVWAIGSLEVGRSAAVRAGDEPLAARAEDLLRRLRAGRTPPRDGFYDRLAQWDGVRMR